MKVVPNKTLFDMVIFDGASNVQKAGRTVAAQFHMVVVTHETEHIGSPCQLQLMSNFVWIVSFEWIFLFICYFFKNNITPFFHISALKFS